MKSNNYNAGSFRLETAGKKATLYYKDEMFLEGCEAILQLVLDMGLEDYNLLDGLGATDEEFGWLEKMLLKHVLNDSICVRK